MAATLFAICGAAALAILAGLVASSFIEASRERRRVAQSHSKGGN